MNPTPGLQNVVDRPYTDNMRGDVYPRKNGCRGEARYRIIYRYKKKRYEITSDEHGVVLANRRQAKDLQEKISREIEVEEKGGPEHNPQKYLPGRKNEWSFTNLAEKYLVATKERVSPAWYPDIKRYFEKGFIPYFKNIDIRSIKAHSLNDLLIYLKDEPLKWKDKNLKNAVDSLRTFFIWAVDGEYISTCPKFPAVKVPKKAVKWADYETQNIIIAAITPEYHRPIVWFGARHGMRINELRALKVMDLDFSKRQNFPCGSVTVQRAFSGDGYMEEKGTKTGGVVILPIHPELLSTLQELCKNKLKNSYVFTLPSGTPYTQTRLYKIVRKAAKVAEIDIAPYALFRHSVLTQAAARGVGGIILQKYAGHTSLSTTQRYIDSAALGVEGVQSVTPSDNGNIINIKKG
ncbi:MAG: site-specific integrase [Nitrospinota bacterium]|nr:site-specific integrase [Nitrospinota bacterium]